MWELHREFGRVVRLGGLLGHPDLLFVFDASLVEQIFRREEAMPHRPSMPSLHHYKNVMRKQFFGDTPGVIGVYVTIFLYIFVSLIHVDFYFSEKKTQKTSHHMLIFFSNKIYSKIVHESFILSIDRVEVLRNYMILVLCVSL